MKKINLTEAEYTIFAPTHVLENERGSKDIGKWVEINRLRTNWLNSADPIIRKKHIVSISKLSEDIIVVNYTVEDMNYEDVCYTVVYKGILR